MCNLFRNTMPFSMLADTFSVFDTPFRWAGGMIPNFPPTEEIRITDKAPIVQRVDGSVTGSLTPWAWRGPHGKPVFNFRSEGRDFSKSDRCLIPADGFYEFTAPADPAKKRKDKHLFTLVGEPWFWIAGIVKEGAFTMLTTSPGPDIAPFHDRQIVVMPVSRGLDWLDLKADVFAPLPAGSLSRETLG